MKLNDQIIKRGTSLLIISHCLEMGILQIKSTSCLGQSYLNHNPSALRLQIWEFINIHNSSYPLWKDCNELISVGLTELKQYGHI